MKINYHEDTDSLYIHLSAYPTEESEEIAPDTVAHFDHSGELTGIEFYCDFETKFGLEPIEVTGLEVEHELEIERIP